MRTSSLTWFLCALAAAGCDERAAQPAPPPSAATSPSPPAQLTVGPISYFQEHCSRCHGSYGGGFLADSLARYDTAGLQRIVTSMTVGPAQAPILGDDLTALVAYVQSIRMGKPFIAIVRRNEDGSFAGEVSPKSSLQLIRGDQPPANVPVNRYSWSIAPDKPLDNNARLVATLKENTTSLPIGESFPKE